MADYKRIVSYMYDYEDNIKKSNVGFARVESRNGQCKIVINIKASSLNSNNLKGYIFKRENGKMIPILMGNIAVRNGTADFRITTNPTRIMNTASTLEQMCGIVIYYSKDKFYATEWDDNPITNESMEMFEETERKDTEKKKDLEEKKELDIPSISPEDMKNEVSTEELLPPHQEKVKKEEKIQEIPIMKYTKRLDEHPLINKEKVEEAKQAETIEKADSIEKLTSMETPETFHNELFSEKREGVSESDIPLNPSAARIFSRFMAIHPFETKEIMECVRIEPQDIGVFPMDNWFLGNNSFLLHGYYNYRHLIFARRRTESGCEYIIGVPGVYQNREKFVARMFGFEHFQPTEVKDRKTGEFGYWYTSIII